CFRVEVGPMKQALVGAAVGAIAATAIVTVYEGQVAVKNAHGETRLAAGERGTLRGEQAPRGPTPQAGAARRRRRQHPRGGPGTSATRAELLARDEAHRQQIAALESELTALQRDHAKGPSGSPKPRGGDGDRGKYFDFTPEELRDLARTCTVKFDNPFYHGQ